MGDPSDSSPENDASLPPSQPRPMRSRPDLSGVGDPLRPARIQMIGALLLGLVLVAVPLYLWRRPRSVPDGPPPPEPSASTAASVPAAPAASQPGVVDAASEAASPAVSLGPARILECHDSGPKRTAPVDCDHLPPIESAIGNAILGLASCVPAEAGGGTVEYVVDVSFARKHTPFYVTTPREGRTLRSAHVAARCALAVKHELTKTPLDVPHQHGRYKIAVSATYP